MKKYVPLFEEYVNKLSAQEEYRNEKNDDHDIKRHVSSLGYSYPDNYKIISSDYYDEEGDECGTEYTFVPKDYELQGGEYEEKDDRFIPTVVFQALKKGEPGCIFIKYSNPNTHKFF